MNGRERGPGRGGPGGRGPDAPRPERRGPHGAQPAGDPPLDGHRALRQEVAAALLRPGVMERVSPGFYFQRCLKLWDSSLGRVRNDKREALRPLQASQASGARIVRGDPDLHRALLVRQAQSFEALRAVSSGGIVKRLRSLTPFVTGIGQPHPLETGFAFLKPYGVPYLAASGVKGAVRAACAAGWKERFDADTDQQRLLLRHYFGSEDKDPNQRRREEGGGHRRGALVFFDLLPELPSNASDGWAEVLRLDIVNPHYGEYYRGESVPADWLSPVPSYFLTLRAGLEWSLYVLYAPLGETAQPGWRDEIEPGLHAALTANGLGAKKSWGYGLFDVLRETSAASAERPTATTSVSGGTAGQAPAPSTPGISATVGATRAFIAALRSHEVKGKISALESALRACPPGDQPALLAEVEQKLNGLDLSRREIRDVLERLRRALGLGAS